MPCKYLSWQTQTHPSTPDILGPPYNLDPSPVPWHIGPHLVCSEYLFISFHVNPTTSSIPQVHPPFVQFPVFISPVHNCPSLPKKTSRHSLHTCLKSAHFSSISQNLKQCGHIYLQLGMWAVGGITLYLSQPSTSKGFFIAGPSGLGSVAAQQPSSHSTCHASQLSHQTGFTG